MMIEISPKTISIDFIDQLSKTPDMLVKTFFDVLMSQTNWYSENKNLSEYFIRKITEIEEGRRSIECIQLVNQIVILLLDIKKTFTEDALFDTFFLAMHYRSEKRCQNCFDSFWRHYNLSISHEDFKTIVVEVRYQNSESLEEVKKVLVKLKKHFAIKIVVYTSESVLEESNNSLVNFTKEFGDDIYSLALSNYDNKMSSKNLEQVFKNCKNLKQLNFASHLEILNKIISVLTSLETLSLSYSSMLKLSLNTFTSLRELDLECCHYLNEIEGLAEAKHLIKVKITDSPHIKVSLWQDYKSLEEIKLIGRNTKVIQFSNLENLKTIDIFQSEIEEMSLINLPKLEKVYFNSNANKLKINSSNLKSLKDIDLGKISVDISDVMPLLLQLVENKINFAEFIKEKKIFLPFPSDLVDDIPKLKMMNDLNTVQSEIKKDRTKIDEFFEIKNENSQKFIEYLRLSLLAFPALALHLIQHNRNELHQLTDEIDLEYPQAMTILPYLSQARVQRLISSALLEKTSAKQNVIQFKQFQGDVIKVFGEVHNELKNWPFEEILIISQELLSLFSFEELAQIFSQLTAQEELFLIDFIPSMTEIQWAVSLPILNDTSFLEALKKVSLTQHVNYLRYSTSDQHVLFLQQFSDSNATNQQRLDNFKARKAALNNKDEYTVFLNEWRTFYREASFDITNKLDAYSGLAKLFSETLTRKEIISLCPLFFQNAKEFKDFNLALKETNQAFQTDYDTNFADEEPDAEFICPISLCEMKDPVLDPQGRTADRESFLRSLREQGTNPFDRSELTEEMLKPDENLKKRIVEWKEKRKAKNQKKQ